MPRSRVNPAVDRDVGSLSRVAPRVMVYPLGGAVPAVAADCITLAQLPRGAGRAAVFGDGSHATTRLCAAAVDLLCRQRKPEAVLDVGTGTGVLARIARARGARFVVATDIDPVALVCAKEHAELDHELVPIQFSSAAPDHWGARFELVIANILEAPLRALAPALRRALRPDGVLLLSGVTRPQIPALRVLYEHEGLTFERQAGLDDWALLAFTRGED
jgi:ribosomal protein L11 methyltransferase